MNATMNLLSGPYISLILQWCEKKKITNYNLFSHLTVEKLAQNQSYDVRECAISITHIATLLFGKTKSVFVLATPIISLDFICIEGIPVARLTSSKSKKKKLYI